MGLSINNYKELAKMTITRQVQITWKYSLVVGRNGQDFDDGIGQNRSTPAEIIDVCSLNPPVTVTCRIQKGLRFFLLTIINFNFIISVCIFQGCYPLY